MKYGKLTLLEPPGPVPVRTGIELFIFMLLYTECPTMIYFVAMFQKCSNASGYREFYCALED
jgi:hypothetical protein